MSKELQTSNPVMLPVAQRAAIALGLTDEKKAELKALAARTATITAITNADGYKQVHAGRMALKNERIELQKIGKAARQDATDYSKAVIAQENSAVEIIEPEEKRLQALQDEADAKEEREQKERAEAEQRRVEGIKARIAEIRGAVEACTRFDSKAELIAQHIEDVQRIDIDGSFAEFQLEASDTKVATLARLYDAHINAQAREEEQRQAAAARAELEKLRADAAAREARERAERETRELAERQEREAAEKAQREQLAAEQAERARVQKIEQDRIDAENRKLAEERAAFERQQAEARAKTEAEEARKRAEADAERKRKEEADRLAKKAKFPGERAIVDALMEHFAVPEAVVQKWLSQLKQVAA